MKRLIMKKTADGQDAYDFINKLVREKDYVPSNEEILGAIKSNVELTLTILNDLKNNNIELPQDVLFEIVKIYPEAIKAIRYPSDEIQKYICENHRNLLKEIFYPNKETERYMDMVKKTYHDWDNRDLAIAYIDGKIYSGDNHPECFKQYNKDKENEKITVYHRSEIPEFVENTDSKLPIACANLVDTPQRDYTGISKAIYIDPITVFNVTIEEVVKAIKKEFADYPIYNEGEYTIDLGNEMIYFDRLARLKKRMKI